MLPLFWHIDHMLTGPPWADLGMKCTSQQLCVQPCIVGFGRPCFPAWTVPPLPGQSARQNEGIPDWNRAASSDTVGFFVAGSSFVGAAGSGVVWVVTLAGGVVLPFVASKPTSNR